MSVLALPFVRPTAGRLLFPTAYRSLEPRGVKPAPSVPENDIARKIESGLDRLLRDIEKLEDAERWDGMS